MALGVMIDIETLATHENALITSIGAVAWQKAMPTEEALWKRFHVGIDIKSAQALGLQIEAGTLLFWLDQNTEAQKELRGQTPIRAALGQFYNWYSDLGKVDEIWAKPPSFDCRILANAYRAAGMSVPWSHREERCLRTVLDLAKWGGRLTPVAWEGEAHNALDDAMYQARQLVACQQVLRA